MFLAEAPRKNTVEYDRQTCTSSEPPKSGPNTDTPETAETQDLPAYVCAEARTLFASQRWRRFHRAASGRGKCFHCQMVIEEGALKLWLPIYVHQTPPAAHASCELRFDLWGAHYVPKEWNAWQEKKFALTEENTPLADLDEQAAVLTWLAGGLASANTPAVLGPAVSEDELLRRVAAAQQWAKAKYAQRGMRQVYRYIV
jgi:hypothetical protein